VNALWSSSTDARAGVRLYADVAALLDPGAPIVAYLAAQ